MWHTITQHGHAVTELTKLDLEVRLYDSRDLWRQPDGLPEGTWATFFLSWRDGLSVTLPLLGTCPLSWQKPIFQARSTSDKYVLSTLSNGAKIKTVYYKSVSKRFYTKQLVTSVRGIMLYVWMGIEANSQRSASGLGFNVLFSKICWKKWICKKHFLQRFVHSPNVYFTK